MFRLFTGPVIIGILASLFTYFLSPYIIYNPGIVSIIGEFVLGLSSFYFDGMPRLVARYIANLNLLVAAITVGILMTVAVQLLMIIWGILGSMAKWLISLLHWNKKEQEPEDLPPIDMDPSFKPSAIGKGVVGRGLDSIDLN